MDSLKERLSHDWFILVSLVSKDFKLKYRRSVLGVLWSVLNPLLTMIVLAAVFTFIFRGNASTQPFPVYLILGNTIFGLMAASTTSGAGSILDSAALIKKIRVNKMIFPLEKVLFELLNFAFSLIAVVLVMAVFRILPTWDIVFLPLLIIYMLIFCAGLSFLLSALAVFFTDIIYLWGVIITAWTYATPLFYPIQALPLLMQTLMQFNPMYHYVTYFRAIAMHGVPASLSARLANMVGIPIVNPWPVPGLQENLICLGMALATLLVGVLVFRATQKKFILFV
ncbi:MAG: ABC transporter permease [Actinomycetia bacterium]|nr:ABC transporter permease [Actinomycetes bacterium]